MKIEKELCLKKFVENISAEYFKDNAPRHPTHFNRSEEIEEDTMHTIWSAAAKVTFKLIYILLNQNNRDKEQQKKKRKKIHLKI